MPGLKTLLGCISPSPQSPAPCPWCTCAIAGSRPCLWTLRHVSDSHNRVTIKVKDTAVYVSGRRKQHLPRTCPIEANLSPSRAAAAAANAPWPRPRHQSASDARLWTRSIRSLPNIAGKVPAPCRRNSASQGRRNKGAIRPFWRQRASPADRYTRQEEDCDPEMVHCCRRRGRAGMSVKLCSGANQRPDERKRPRPDLNSKVEGEASTKFCSAVSIIVMTRLRPGRQHAPAISAERLDVAEKFSRFADNHHEPGVRSRFLAGRGRSRTASHDPSRKRPPWSSRRHELPLSPAIRYKAHLDNTTAQRPLVWDIFGKLDSTLRAKSPRCIKYLQVKFRLLGSGTGLAA